ncbi:hypothetical protein PHMEG_0007752 [Phytophthora megakarya]|uniref:Uncharacterized protein n=1 Tax=Phytophthora megakarya TaxID=4795 RepID=A0A225WL92_9STRA|nr:hypothetical protein PHMEG_0007752 [Phytophthora megakarya]
MVRLRSSEDWAAAAQAEPEQLLFTVQRFPYPEELIAKLSAKIIIAWTSRWRRECMQAGITTFKARTRDPLDNWMGKFERPAPTNLASLVNNREDWVQLRERGYGQDTVLQLCDVNNKARLAQHILCATIYAREITILIGQEDSGDSSVVGCLRRHTRGLREHKEYAEAYYTEKKFIHWLRVAEFFATAWAYGEEEMLRHPSTALRKSY